MTRPITVLGFFLLITVQCALADDLSLFDGGFVGVPPNVMVIFDNSVSMMNCPGTNNSADWKCNNNVKMKIVRDVLVTIFESEQAKKLRLGLMSFVKDSDGEGGRIHLPCGASSVVLQQRVVDIAGVGGDGVALPRASQSKLLPYNGSTGTPLGEALAEAGLYFAGKGSAYLKNWPTASKYGSVEQATVDGVSNVAWYQNSAYVSPIAASCQKNFVVYLTDGEPHRDDPIVNPYMTGMPNLIDRPNPTGIQGQMLDDVANYLYNHDFSSISGNQNIETVIIGFDIDPETTQKEEEKKAYQAALDLMKQAAKDGNGGQDGNFYMVNGVDTETIKNELTKAFTTIFENIIAEVNATYVAPVIPTNPDNRTDAGNRVYMGFFKPQASGRWIGNLKAYGLVGGILQDSTGVQATIETGPNAGVIKDSAKSYWSTAADGLDVDRGGVGEVLANRNQATNSRKIYTFIDDHADHPVDLTDASNRFALSNTYLTPAKVVGPGSTDSTKRDQVINDTLAKVKVSRDDKSTVYWQLGAIVHSAPFVKYYEDLQKSYLFVGANDGMLHVFDVADNSGQEVWAFVPPGQLGKLEDLFVTDGKPRYAVDGSPVIEAVKKSDNSTMQLLVFGERRGGSNYYALDVTNPDQPAWKYQLTDTLLTGLDWDKNGVPDGTAAKLGLSWAKPQFKKVRSGNQMKEVFLLAGGYDAGYDNSVPANPLGRAIYAVQADSADPPTVFGLNINAGNWKDASNNPYMTHSILDVTGFDRSGYGYLDRLYAGDLGGRLFAARYQRCTDTECTNDYWQPNFLFDLSSSGLGKKIMTRPEVTLEPGKECVYFGTGDRENPKETAIQNAIYAVCNSWADTQPSPLSIINLADVTENLVQQGDAAQKAAAAAAIKGGYGWYLRLTNPGEKLVSSPKLLNKKLYFATFTPGQTLASSDPCIASYNFGLSRLYVVDYQTGGAVINFKDDEVWTKEDRSKVIGTMITGDPVLTSNGEETSIFYGSGGKFEGMPVETSPILRRYFWRQLK